MPWLGRIFGSAGSPQADANAEHMAAWKQALQSNGLPPFVEARLGAAAVGKTPWLSTTTPAELAIVRRHGIRPIAMVSGTCWYHYGYSWTLGHPEGWNTALARLRAEAVAAGANAVVDVTLRTIPLRAESSMDFTVVGTAVKIEGLPQSTTPVIATVPALEFVRLLRSGIVPTGIAIGAAYNVSAPLRNVTGGGLFATWKNQPLPELSRFWEDIRRTALQELHRHTQREGNGVLAHSHFGQLLKIERDKAPPQFLGRHIVVGTIVHTRRSVTNSPIDVKTVVDMRDGASPLASARPHGHSAFPVHEQEGPI